MNAWHRGACLAAILGLTVPGAALAASAELKDADGKTVGTAELQDTPSGLLMTVTLQGLSPGEHAFHIHETGACEPPAFESAGGHFNPHGKEHGYMSPAGNHAGDLPNIHVPESGNLTFEAIARQASLGDGPGNVLDSDGSALMIHAGPDDYKTDPAGGAGDRIACGVIQR